MAQWLGQESELWTRLINKTRDSIISTQTRAGLIIIKSFGRGLQGRVEITQDPHINQIMAFSNSDGAYKAEVRHTGTRGFGDSSVSQSYRGTDPEEVSLQLTFIATSKSYYN